MAELNPKDFLERLFKRQLITAAAARRAEAASTQTKTPIERSLLEFGLIEEVTLYQELAAYLGLPFVDETELDAAFTRSLPLSADFLLRTEVVPVRETAEGIVLATADPRAIEVLQGIGYHLQSPIFMAITGPTTIRTFLQSLDQDKTGDPTDASDHDIQRLNELANDGPIIKLVNEMIGKAAQTGASDIHIETEESGARVRFRVDGALQTRQVISPAQLSAVVSRLKIMASLNISEKRRPQDGRAQVTVRGRPIDIRLSTLPTQYGESLVMRLLDRSRVALDWKALGFGKKRRDQIKRITSLPNGIFLVAGPTGSGKTTTLYTVLSELNAERLKIVTVEDPIEYSLQGINQVQVAPQIDMDFSRALRAILRQDPDVIMVGEIRDQETAEIAVRAALVGRLVLSTVHTNDALSAVTRLVDLGVQPFLLADTLRGVLSQRLVRLNCTNCGGRGCDHCGETGKKGRTVISELLEITPEVAGAVSSEATSDQLSTVARAGGFRTMQEECAELSPGLIGEEELRRALGGL